MADCNPAFAKSAIELFGSAYPEMLGLYIIVDAPSVFWALFRVIKPLIPPKTAAKVRFIDSKKHSENLAMLTGALGDSNVAANLVRMIEDDAR